MKKVRVITAEEAALMVKDGDTVTVKNLTVMRVDEEQNLILVKGAIPGGKNGIVRVRMA